VVEGFAAGVAGLTVKTRADLGVDNGYGLYFDRISGAYGVIRDNLHKYYVRDHRDMSIMTHNRSAANTTNDNRGARAQLFSARRVV
jgi:hypothetical protein